MNRMKSLSLLCKRNGRRNRSDFWQDRKHIFAKLTYIDPNTEEPMQMGYDLSAKLYEELKQHGYIDGKGKAKPELKEAIDNDTLQMSDEFRPWKQAILHEINHYLQHLPIKDATKKKRVQLNKQVFLVKSFASFGSELNIRRSTPFKSTAINLFKKHKEHSKHAAY